MAVLTIRIDEAEKEKLAQVAKEEDLTVSQLVRRAIKEFLASK